jgi:uncharacterized protein YkwD
MRRRLRGYVLLGLLLVLTSVPAAAMSVSPAVEKALLTRLNAIRHRQGLAPLRLYHRLIAVARGHSRYLARIQRLDHLSADGTPAQDRIWQTLRAALVGETLAVGPNARWIATAWLQSPPHRAILLNPAFRWVGIGVVRGGPAGAPTYWTTADYGS